jgi:hypothetical protein
MPTWPDVCTTELARASACELHALIEAILSAVGAESAYPVQIRDKSTLAEVALPPDLQHALLVVVPRG